ncbi:MULTISPECIES: flagellar export chaperone FliS [unclassified Thioalkalivibrio]|uniref:flagellar export chaperone FliS n=1 Tax=unclassified Thioalkalivibrio TaxID=2621013 RepID=UPI0004762A8F|nr:MULTISPECIES: flagellar export chaperone FliS [unclassified Thioalkalivibrio]
MYGPGMNRAVNQYREAGPMAEAQVANPHRLIQMLFEGALERIAVAKGAIQQGNVTVKGERIGKAIDIVESLRAMLDHKHRPELAANLDALYGYMSRRLLEGNAQNDPEALDEVAKLLREIKAGWDEIPPEERQRKAG